MDRERWRVIFPPYYCSIYSENSSLGLIFKFQMFSVWKVRNQSIFSRESVYKVESKSFFMGKFIKYEQGKKCYFII